MYIFIKYHSQTHFENLFFMIASAKVMSRVSFAEFGIINYGKSTIFSEKVSERMKKVPFDLQLFSSFDPPPPSPPVDIEFRSDKVLPSRAWSLIFKFGRLWYLSRECRRELKPWIKPRSRSPRSSQQQWTKQQPR